VASNEGGFGGIYLFDATVKGNLVVAVNASAFVVSAEYALAYLVVDFAGGRDKHVAVHTGKVRVEIQGIGDGDFDLGTHGAVLSNWVRCVGIGRRILPPRGGRCAVDHIM
jgi:hypothetical protein